MEESNKKMKPLTKAQRSVMHLSIIRAMAKNPEFREKMIKIFKGLQKEKVLSSSKPLT